MQSVQKEPKYCSLANNYQISMSWGGGLKSVNTQFVNENLKALLT
jgi:hypothetical protein